MCFLTENRHSLADVLYVGLTNTVDSRYLEFQGTLWNTSKYP